MSGKPKENTLLRELRNLWEHDIFRTVFLLLLVLVCNFIFQHGLVLILKTEYPLHTPISGSMEPTLKVGDLLVIQGGLRGEDVYAHPGNGDIIIFRDPRNPSGIPIVHRAVRKFQEDGKWYFITKGDANLYDDYTIWGWKVPEEYLLGKVIASFPLLGQFLRFLDETNIYFYRYVINLRTMIIIFLVVCILVLELTGPSGTTEKTHEAKKGTDKEKETARMNH